MYKDTVSQVGVTIGGASVAVYQGDKESQGAEGKEASDHRFHQKCSPATQEKDMHKRPRKAERRSDKSNSPRHNELRRGPAQRSDHDLIFPFSCVPGHHQVQTHQVSQVYSSFHELLKHKTKFRSRQANSMFHTYTHTPNPTK
ncbi:Filaggrin, partial [Ophiophagus hannah]